MVAKTSTSRGFVTNVKCVMTLISATSVILSGRTCTTPNIPSRPSKEASEVVHEG
jgi:hypothetical protein